MLTVIVDASSCFLRYTSLLEVLAKMRRLRQRHIPKVRIITLLEFDSTKLVGEKTHRFEEHEATWSNHTTSNSILVALMPCACQVVAVLSWVICGVSICIACCCHSSIQVRHWDWEMAHDHCILLWNYCVWLYNQCITCNILAGVYIAMYCCIILYNSTTYIYILYTLLDIVT